MLQPKI